MRNGFTTIHPFTILQCQYAAPGGTEGEPVTSALEDGNPGGGWVRFPEPGAGPVATVKRNRTYAAAPTASRAGRPASAGAGPRPAPDTGTRRRAVASEPSDDVPSRATVDAPADRTTVTEPGERPTPLRAQTDGRD